MLPLALSLFVLAAPALAHFKLDYPTARGYNAQNETSFCGGFPNATVPRTQWGFNNGPIQFDSLEDDATVDIYISFLEAPQDLTDFTESDLPELKSGLKILGRGEFCFHSNIITTLASAGGDTTTGGQSLVPGTNATILVEYKGDEGTFQACSDVTFSKDSDFTGSCSDSLTADGASSSLSNYLTPSENETRKVQMIPLFLSMLSLNFLVL